MKKLNILVSGAMLLSLIWAPLAMALTPPITAPTRLPFIRMYNSAINDHFYTSSQAEADSAQSNHGYKMEGTLGYVESTQVSGTKAIIRMWNPRALKHFYTTDSGEASIAQSAGFVLEGTVGYIQTDTAPTSGDQAFAPPIEIPASSKYLYRMYNSSLRKHFYTIDKPEMTGLQNHGYRLEGNLGNLYSAIYDNTKCPDEWILNNMPSVVGSNASNEYFIVNGSRVELDQYDVDWVQEYCGITKQIVY